jgi:hypothetical protein
MGRNVQDLIEQTLHFPLSPNEHKMQKSLGRDQKKKLKTIFFTSKTLSTIYIGGTTRLEGWWGGGGA